MRDRAVEIENVGPLEHFRIELPPSGVVCLVGRNGSGKTAALEAVRSLLGTGRPTSRDGSLGAQVTGLGARLTVSRRSTRSGEIQIDHLEGEDVGLLIAPPLKDPAAADAARVRAMVRLARVPVSIEPFAKLLAGGVDELMELCRDATLERGDLVELAAALKRDIESAARRSEGEAKNFEGKARGRLEAIDQLLSESGRESIPAELPPVADARIAHESALGSLRAAEGARASNRKLIAAASQARAVLDEMGDRGTEDAIHSASCIASESQDDVESREAALREAELRLRDARASRQAAQEAHQEQLRAKRQRDQLELALVEAEGVTEISDEQIEALRTAADEARAISEAATFAERTAGMRADAEGYQRQAQEASIRASELRQASRGTEAVIMEAVAEVCGDDMELHEGRLFIQHEGRGRKIPFAELSPGERARKALEIATASLGGRTEAQGSLFICAQEIWESLDPKNREEIDAVAHEYGVVILTALPADGELRVAA